MKRIKTLEETKVGSTLRPKGWKGMTDDHIAEQLVRRGLAEYPKVKRESRTKQVSDNDTK